MRIRGLGQYREVPQAASGREKVNGVRWRIERYGSKEKPAGFVPAGFSVLGVVVSDEAN
jgi:hypothetical protein